VNEADVNERSEKSVNAVVEVKPTPVFVNALPPAEYADPDVFEISFEVE